MSEVKMNVTIAGVPFKNPITTASGTFGSGKEYSQFVDLNKLGAITVKGVSLTEWIGNPTPRITETYGGMLNAIGLQNPGVEAFIENDLKFLKRYDTPVIVNVCGHSIEEYCQVVEILNDEPIDMFELNISCPNVSEGGIAFGTDVNMVNKVVSEVKKKAKKPMLVKLSPNVTNIVEIAKAAEAAGADGLSLINTLLGMSINLRTKRPLLANKTGGLSGPAIKPVAIRMVYDVARSVSVPIVGMGGVMTGEDAIEFMMAGASAVAVGTANFTNPHATMDIIRGMQTFLEENHISDINDIIGVAYKN